MVIYSTSIAEEIFINVKCNCDWTCCVKCFSDWVVVPQNSCWTLDASMTNERFTLILTFRLTRGDYQILRCVRVALFTCQSIKLKILKSWIHLASICTTPLLWEETWNEVLYGQHHIDGTMSHCTKPVRHGICETESPASWALHLVIHRMKAIRPFWSHIKVLRKLYNSRCFVLLNVLIEYWVRFLFLKSKFVLKFWVRKIIERILMCFERHPKVSLCFYFIYYWLADWLVLICMSMTEY